MSRGKAREFGVRPTFVGRSDATKRNAAYGLFITPYLKLHEAFHLRQHLIIGKMTGNNRRRRTDRRAKTAAFAQRLVDFGNTFLSH